MALYGYTVIAGIIIWCGMAMGTRGLAGIFVRGEEPKMPPICTKKAPPYVQKGPTYVQNHSPYVQKSTPNGEKSSKNDTTW